MEIPYSESFRIGVSMRQISEIRALAYYIDDCFFSKGGEGEGEKERKEKESNLKSSSSDSKFSRRENDSRVNLSPIET